MFFPKKEPLGIGILRDGKLCDSCKSNLVFRE